MADTNQWTTIFDQSDLPKLHGLETPDDFFCKYGKPKKSNDKYPPQKLQSV